MADREQRVIYIFHPAWIQKYGERYRELYDEAEVVLVTSQMPDVLKTDIFHSIVRLFGFSRF